MFGISRQVIYSRSRNRRFLLRAGLLILGLSLVAATILWLLVGRQFTPDKRLEAHAANDPEMMLEVIRHAPLILGPKLETSNGWNFNFPLLKPWKAGGEPVLETALKRLQTILAQSRLDAPDQEVAEHYADALYHFHDAEAARAWLVQQARDPNRLYANECLGDLASGREEAIAYYKAELARRESQYARDEILSHLRESERWDDLRAALRDPAFQRGASHHELGNAAVALKDIGGVFRYALMSVLSNLRVDYVFMALFSGLIWGILMGQGAGFRRDQLVLYGLATFLGAISVVLTLFLVLLQERVFERMPEQADVVGGLIYFVAGVGLREEFCKLLLFLPLLPWLLRRRNEMEALVAAGFVGLGFAVMENLSYFSRADQTVTVSRFLTATFLHVTWTGLAGHAAYRMMRNPRQWDQFLLTFLLVVVIHGLYDAFIVLPDLRDDYGPLTIVILALMAYRYFDTAEHLTWTGNRHLSPLGVFVIGLALLVGLSLNVMCFGLEPMPYYMLFMLQCIGLIPVAFIYVNRYGKH